MKKITFILVAMMMNINLFSQIQIDTSKLSASAKAEILRVQQQQQITTTIEDASSWAGMGKEIGEAVNGGLGAIADNVDKVGNTKVGKFTMIIIAYKVIGKQLIGFVVIPIIMLVVLFTFIWLVKKFCFPYRYISKDALKDEKGKITQPAEYKTQDPDYMINARAWVSGIFILVEIILVVIMVNIS